MHAELRYVCDTCKLDKHTTEEALACEARGVQVIPEYLVSRVGKEVRHLTVACYIDGGNIFEWCHVRLDGFVQEGHQMRVKLSQGNSWSGHRDIDELDPLSRFGSDYFLELADNYGDALFNDRFTRDRLKFWMSWCDELGVPYDVTQALWFQKAHVSDKERVLRVMKTLV